MKNYFDKVHKWGTIWNYAALAVMLALPVAMSAYMDAWPQASVLAKILPTLMLLYWTTAVIEVTTYVPMLGAGGTYLCFVTGNISNLKLPCGLSAMENAKVRPNTEEGEVISTMAIGVSSITTTVIIAVGVLLFAPVLPKLTEEGSVFKSAFEQVLPALFGALGASYLVKHWRIAIAPILCGIIVLLFAPTVQVGVLMVVTIIVSIVSALMIYKSLWKPIVAEMKGKKAAK